MNLRKQDLRGTVLTDLVDSGTDLVGADLRGADLRDADLRRLDLRGTDLRGADLRGATHVSLTELVDFVHGKWIGLAAWNKDTQFPPEIDEKLWTLGLRETNGTSKDAIRRGLAAIARSPLSKSDWSDVTPFSSRDG